MQKTAYSFQQQVDRLKNIHGLNIENNDKAINIVKSMNYFTIRGYGHQYIVDNTQKEYKFITNTKIEDIYNIYLFDCELKSKLIYIIGIIEKRIRSEIANILAVQYCNADTAACNYYPNTNCFSNNDVANEILEREWLKQKKMFEKQICDDIIKHYMTYHNEKLPIWLLVEYMAIGDLQKLFNRCLFNKDAISVAKSFNLDTKHFSNYLEIIRNLRNICCHFNRLYGRNNLLIPKPLCKLSQNDLAQWQKNRLHSTIVVLKEMCNSNKSEWNHFVDEVDNLINKYKNVINFDYLKMLKNWKENIKL